MEVFSRKPELLPGELLDIELLRKFQESPLQVSLNMLLTLRNYDIKEANST